MCVTIAPHAAAVVKTLGQGKLDFGWGEVGPAWHPEHELVEAFWPAVFCMQAEEHALLFDWAGAGGLVALVAS
jgi:hypothetical protein